MAQICVDASVALKLVLDEEGSDAAYALWASWVAEELEIIAPCHLAFEVTSVIRNHVYVSPSPMLFRSLVPLSPPLPVTLSASLPCSSAPLLLVTLPCPEPFDFASKGCLPSSNPFVGQSQGLLI